MAKSAVFKRNFTVDRSQQRKRSLFLFGFARIARTAAALFRFARIARTAAALFGFARIATAATTFFGFAGVAATARLTCRKLDTAIGLRRSHGQNINCANAGQRCNTDNGNGCFESRIFNRHIFSFCWSL